MTATNENKQKALYTEAEKYRRLNEVEQQIFWQQKQIEYQVMSGAEKELWKKATDENLLEIKQHLLLMRQRIDLLKSTSTV